jgi:hypothetical protein
VFPLWGLSMQINPIPAGAFLGLPSLWMAFRLILAIFGLIQSFGNALKFFISIFNCSIDAL